jgi:hypothetical protein
LPNAVSTFAFPVDAAGNSDTTSLVALLDGNAASPGNRLLAAETGSLGTGTFTVGQTTPASSNNKVVVGNYTVLFISSGGTDFCVVHTYAIAND